MEENFNNNQQPTMQEPKKQDIGSKTKKKKAKIAVITLSTIIVLVLGLQIYAATNGYGNIFFMIRDWTTSKNASGEDEVFKEGKTTIEELDVNSSMVKNLYEYIPAFNENRIRVNAYQNKKITKNDLDNKYLLAYAFKNLELKDSEKTTTMQNGQPLDGWYSFEASKLQDKAKEMYGTEIENEDFEIGYGAGCTYKNQKYSYSSGGGSGEYMTNIKNIEKAYQENDLLFIEDKYIAIKENGDKAALYKASNSNIELETIDLSNYTDEDTLSKYIIKKHSNKMISFKHTFKKNSDGNYYWYSTEPLEEIKEEANTSEITNTDNNNDKDLDFFEKETKGYLGVWKVKKAYNDTKEVSLQEIYGTSVKYGVGNLSINTDGTFTDKIAPVYESEDSRAGKYMINDNEIVLKYNNGNSRSISYNSVDKVITYNVFDKYYLVMEKQGK